MISVSSVGPSTTKADYSNYGLGDVEVAAPGGWFRDGVGTPTLQTPGNLILSTYPLDVAIEEGLADENGSSHRRLLGGRLQRPRRLRVLHLPAGHLDGVTARRRRRRADHRPVRPHGPSRRQVPGSARPSAASWRARPPTTPARPAASRSTPTRAVRRTGTRCARGRRTTTGCTARASSTPPAPSRPAGTEPAAAPPPPPFYGPLCRGAAIRAVIPLRVGVRDDHVRPVCPPPVQPSPRRRRLRPRLSGAGPGRGCCRLGSRRSPAAPTCRTRSVDPPGPRCRATRMPVLVDRTRSRGRSSGPSAPSFPESSLPSARSWRARTKAPMPGSV